MSEALPRLSGEGRHQGFQPIANRDEILGEMCHRLANGESLVAICAEDGMPGTSTFFRWLSADSDAWAIYMRAREVQAHNYASKAVREAETATDAALGRLRMDALKWAAGKLAPKYYGDSTQLRHADADGNKLDTAPLVGELLGLLGTTPDQAAPQMLDVTPTRVEHKVLTPAERFPEPAKRPAYRPRARPAEDVEDLV